MAIAVRSVSSIMSSSFEFSLSACTRRFPSERPLESIENSPGESNRDGCSLDSERGNREFNMLAASWGSTSTRLYGVLVERNVEHSHCLLGGLGERDNGIVVAFEISFAERVGLLYLSELLSL